MVQSIHTEIEINSPPSKVRAVFLNFSSIPEWHTGFSMERASTEKPQIEEGDVLNVNASGSKFTPIVLENSPEKFRWVGSIPYIFTGEHCFRFEPSKTTPGGTTLTQSEEFSGMLSFLVGPTWSLGLKTQKQFEDFNASLKKRVESM